MKLSRWRYEWQLTAVAVGLLVAYLALAVLVLAPRGYYGSIAQPRFADPWLARGETILEGGLLYRDVFTSTPPLTNFLFLAPVLFSRSFGHVNPWSTLGFMLFFSLFNLLAALALLHLAPDRRAGFEAGLFFLLNPLTFGNTVLRRQDESVVVFFLALTLLLMMQRRHLAAGVAIGLSLLVKLTGAAVWPVAVLHTRRWTYVVIPVVVFFLAMAPFLLLAGQDAMFWDVGQTHTEHPFQFGGVSLGALWNRWQPAARQIPVSWPSALFVLGVGLVGVRLWRRPGDLLSDLTILVGAVLILSPKLHTGYFSILALSLAPLLRSYRLAPAYFGFGLLALLADFYKWPVENFGLAFGLMVAALALLLAILFRLARPPAAG